MKTKKLIELLKSTPSVNKHSALSRSSAGPMGTKKHKRHPKHKKEETE